MDFDLGFEAAGLKCVAQVENDAAARSVLERHFPHAYRGVTDVCEVRRDNFPTADVFCGGSPCQDVSVAGRRAGLAGERSGLYFEFHRIVTDFRPRWFVFENVPGLLSSRAGRDFAIVLAGFTGVLCDVPEGGWGNAGIARGPLYKVAWRILDAQFFGVAQRRRRVFIVGHLTDGRAAQVLFEREGRFERPPSRRAAGQGTAAPVIKGAAIGRKPENGPQRGDTRNDGVTFTLNTREVHAVATELEAAHSERRMRGFGDYAADDTASSVKARDGKDATDLVAQSVSGTLAARGAGTARTGNERSEADMLIVQPLDVAPALTGSGRGTGRTGESRGQDPLVLAYDIDSKASFAAAFDERNVTSAANRTRVEDGLPANTLHTNGMSVITAYTVRRLTPTECERLQNFPDGWTAEGSNGPQADTTRYRQLGNAVCTSVSEWIARRIVAVERGEAHTQYMFAEVAS